MMVGLERQQIHFLLIFFGSQRSDKNYDEPSLAGFGRQGDGLNGDLGGKIMTSW